MVGDNIVVTVISIRGDRVKLGIVAPNSVSVHRKEVHDALQRDANSSLLPQGEDKTLQDR